jgi:VanZ family protein
VRAELPASATIFKVKAIMSSRFSLRIVNSLSIKVNAVLGMNKMIVLARLIAWLLLVAIVALTLVPPVLRPASGLPHNVEHFAVFCLMGAAFALAYQGRPYSLGLTAILFAAALEVFQILIPGRHARMSDFLVDALGAAAGIAIATLFDRMQRSRHRS